MKCIVHVTYCTLWMHKTRTKMDTLKASKVKNLKKHLIIYFKHASIPVHGQIKGFDRNLNQ